MTNSIQLICRLHEHRAGVNRQLVAVAATLTDEQLQRSFEIGQGSIWKTLTHLYAAEYVWLAALQGEQKPLAPGDVPDKIPGNQEGADRFGSLAELNGQWQALEQRWTAYLSSVTPERLAEPIYKFNSLSGQRSGARCSDVLLHVCTHAQYTVAQLMNMLRHTGLESLPDPMLITLARKDFAAATG